MGYVEHYNNVRLNSAIGYIAPKDMLTGHQEEIQAERDRKLDAARETAEESPPASRVTDERDYFRLTTPEVKLLIYERVYGHRSGTISNSPSL
jgi:hypothetical protein